ncbi:MAG: hypothetical protein MSIBF_04265 [Candidatus Altiarchaeales archaeon IMC4]|nr:MAG: hypothetical protein MSIBF_04265 [Candidatus Altiarchaeales archaeon IMC4]
MEKIEEIKNRLAGYKQELRSEFGVKELGIFGSYVRKEQKEDSDIDVLVEFGGPVSLLKLVGLENRPTDSFGVKVDLIPRADIRPELKEKILHETIYV